MMCLWLHSFFILLNQACCWYFSIAFLILFFSSVWFFLMVSICLLNFSFCLHIVFLISLNYLSVFSYSSLSFLKKTILNSLLGKLHISTSSGLVGYWKIIVFLRDIMFPWFFMFFEKSFSCCCLHIWRSSYHLQSLLTGFGREIPSVSPAEHSEDFSDFFYGNTCSVSLGKFLRWHSLSWSCKAQLNADNLSFAFFRALLNAQVFVLFPKPVELGRLPAHANYLSAKTDTHCPWGHERRAGHMMVGVCVGKLCSVGGICYLVEICRWGIPSGLWLKFLIESSQ